VISSFVPLVNFVFMVFVSLSVLFFVVFLFLFSFHRGTAGNPASYNVEILDFLSEPQITRMTPIRIGPKKTNGAAFTELQLGIASRSLSAKRSAHVHRASEARNNFYRCLVSPRLI